MKIGRNQKCPCGSGIKYKKCCLNKKQSVSQVQVDNMIKEFINKPKEPFEKGGLLTGRPFIDDVFKGKRVRAVGSRIYLRNINETFHEFLIGHLFGLLTQDWILSEKSKKPEERHLIIQWLDETDKLMKTGRQPSKENDVFGVEMTGNVKTLMALAYDFYSLSHCQANILPKLLNRLRNKGQFQGAKYEIAVGGLVVRSGFEIQWINTKETHCEFIGVHKITGQKAAFETKSHHRPGVLGREGTFSTDEAKIKIIDHIKEAREQAPKDIPFIVFNDLNLPLEQNLPMENKRWFTEIDKALKKSGFLVHGTENSFFKDNLSAVCITNFSYHFHKNPEFQKNDVLIFFHQGGRYSLNLETIKFLKKSAEQYGFVPHKLEERKGIK